MSTDIILFSFTFTAGIIAFLNPCGFIMLPAYISNHMEKSLQLQSSTMANNHNSKFSSRKLAYALLVGLVTTTGFITIFSAVGLGISYIGIRIVKLFPPHRLCKCTSCNRNRNSKTYRKIFLPQHPNFQILFEK